MISRSRLSLKAWLPTKAIRLISVDEPSLISKTTSTRFCVQMYDLRLDGGAEASLLGVGVKYLLPVSLGELGREDGARAEFEQRPQRGRRRSCGCPRTRCG